MSKGVAFAVAAGNEDNDANNYSPGGFDNVLSVSALADFNGLPGGGADPTCRTDVDDTLADFSNWGPEVDIAAPGVCILSTYPLEQGAYGTISGTSMASPHAAGALALLASASNPGNATDVYSLYNQVKNAGNDNWTDDSGDDEQEPLLDVSAFVPALIPVSGGGGDTNQPPTASFAYATAGLTVDFTDTSTDSDGSIASWSWAFGEGGTSTLQTPSHVYAAAGTYTVSLTVTDDDAATGSRNQVLTVSSTSVGDISLTWAVHEVNRNKYAADLSWTGASSPSVDVYRTGTPVATTANDGSYTDGPLAKSSSFEYKVCEAGTSTCSNEVIVSW